MERLLRWWFTGLTATTWCLLVFGAAVRAHGAGLACPDWPLCFGEVIPSLNFGVALEWGHRVLAGAVSILLIGGFGLLWRSPRARAAVGWLPLVALGLLATQIVLGGLTVLHLLAPWTVGWHLIVGNAFCASLLLISLQLHALDRPVEGEAPSRAMLVVYGVAAALLFAQFRLGGLVSANGLGMVCPEWPACIGGVWVPTMAYPFGLHLAHRFTGYALVAWFGLIAWLTWGRTDLAGRMGRGAFALVLVQAGVGIANVLGNIPVEVTLLHTGLAAGVVLATTALSWEALRRANALGVAHASPEQEALA